MGKAMGKAAGKAGGKAKGCALGLIPRIFARFLATQNESIAFRSGWCCFGSFFFVMCTVLGTSGPPLYSP